LPPPAAVEGWESGFVGVNGCEVVMQRGWLLVGPVVMILAVFAAPAFAENEGKDHGEESKKKLEEVRTVVEGQGEPKDILERVKKLLEKKHEENIFTGFLDLSIWTIVVFLILFVVLRKYAWGPMMEGLENREKNIRGELESAQKANADAQALRADTTATPNSTVWPPGLGLATSFHLRPFQPTIRGR